MIDKPKSAEFNCSRSQGDFDLFADDDGSGYIVNTYYSHFCIERLDPTFTSGTGETTTIDAMDPTIKGHPDGDEAPSMFKRDGVYHLTYASGCCGCKGGSITWHHTAESPLGPWTKQGVLLTPSGPVTRAQQRAVFTVPAPGGKNRWVDFFLRKPSQGWPRRAHIFLSGARHQRNKRACIMGTPGAFNLLRFSKDLRTG